jgi:type IX secretion system PorP/SprF family membrane protein
MTTSQNIGKMKKVIIILLVFIINKSYSQELNLPVATQYLADNQFVVSPAFAGIGDNFRIRANGFRQWVGIKDAPQNQALYADFRIADQSGIGLSLYNDKNGNTKQSGFKLSFAHHIILDYYSKQYLSFGISYNLNNFRIDTGNFNIVDPSIINDRSTANNNFDVSVLYRIKGLFVSLNGSNILPKDIKQFYKAEPNLLRNYQLYTGYTYKSNRNSRTEIEPSGYFQFFESDKRSSMDLNVKARFYDNQRTGYYWAGLAYRSLIDQPAVPLNFGPMVGLKKGMFYVGYSYQLTLNELAAYNSGTHMITLGLDFLQGISNCPCTQTQVNY